MPKNYKTIDDQLFPSSTTNKYRKINPIQPTTTTTSIDDFSTSTSSTSSSQEEEEVIVHLDCNIGSKLLTNHYKNISKFKLNSNIINNNNIFLSNEIIYHTKHYTKSPPQLLYRGSRDGFNADDFHSRCDNQGPTLTIIKSANEPTNQIFGGFTTQNWHVPPNKYLSDDSAFLFKIDENSNQSTVFRKFNVKQDEKQYAILASTYFLPTFGGGHDICIYSDCNVNNMSFSNFVHTYQLPTTTNDNRSEVQIES